MGNLLLGNLLLILLYLIPTSPTVGMGRMGEKVQGIKSIIGRYKIHRGRLRIAQEMEKPKNLYV